MPYQQNVRVRVEKYVFAFHIILCLDTVSLPSYRLSHQQLPLSIVGMWPHLSVIKSFLSFAQVDSSTFSPSTRFLRVIF